MLRLSIVTETYPPEINGVANTLHHLVVGLEKRGNKVHLIRPRQRFERSEQADHERRETRVPGLPIPGYRGLRFGLPVYRRLRRLWCETPPDSVYIATQGPLGFAALWAARAADIPTVTGFHTRFHEYSGHYGLGFFANCIITTLRRFHNRSGATLVPTEQLRVELRNLGFRNLHCLSRGVDTELFDPRRRSEALRRSWGCQPGDRIVLYVGRLAAEKNLVLVIRAFKSIESRARGAKLVLVGDGPELARLRASHPKMLLTGAKVGVELAEHYASGDLFLFPSLTETFGNVVPEAMASGLPVVAFDYGAAHVCIRSWENGVTVPMGDAQAFSEAATAVACEDARLLTMAKSARVTAEGMSWDWVVQNLEERMLEVIDRHRSGNRHETLASTIE
ncbi:MAG: glycosyltransferase family 1 protein [Chromatiaceae bacterium]|nr:glycosyltransferase family 1 protein [Chromatiaceae bacterium]